MAIIRNFQELTAYQKAHAAAKEVFHLTKRFPREELYSLTDQIRRSSRAIGVMIAEAWARRRYEAVFVNKLNEAQGEAAESQGWLDDALTVNISRPQNTPGTMQCFKNSARSSNA